MAIAFDDSCGSPLAGIPLFGPGCERGLVTSRVRLHRHPLRAGAGEHLHVRRGVDAVPGTDLTAVRLPGADIDARRVATAAGNGFDDARKSRRLSNSERPVRCRLAALGAIAVRSGWSGCGAGDNVAHRAHCVAAVGRRSDCGRVGDVVQVATWRVIRRTDALLERRHVLGWCHTVVHCRSFLRSRRVWRVTASSRRHAAEMGDLVAAGRAGRYRIPGRCSILITGGSAIVV